MSEVQQLREQLDSLGFSLLGDSERQQTTGVLKVEVWVRYTPYSLIPLPIQEDVESDESFDSRLAIANQLISELQEPELPNTEEIDHFASPTDVDAYANNVAEEGIVDNEDLGVPSGNDYYAYTAPPTPTVIEPALEDTVAIMYHDIENKELENNDTDRETLIKIRQTLRDSIEKIDSILAKQLS